MASLLEYFVKDGAENLTIHKTWTLANAGGVALGGAYPTPSFRFRGERQICLVLHPGNAGCRIP
jgi:hypothetical protein